MKIIIINGPNLNLLGTREPSVYGSVTFEQFLDGMKNVFPDIEMEYYQSNIEGEIINKLHEVGFNADGIILNVGGYSHTSVSIADAVKAISSPVVEVHISNIFAREEFRHKSLIAPNVKGCIIGFGLDSYRLALLSFL
ncbi:MAG: type II 3-dehydroquinate dehydratase [Bacteroidetes bacterium]|nr:type II 3-dehydroquinate dehydratase [Bacteroidota bacterium]